MGLEKVGKNFSWEEAGKAGMEKISRNDTPASIHIKRVFLFFQATAYG